MEFDDKECSRDLLGCFIWSDWGKTWKASSGLDAATCRMPISVTMTVESRLTDVFISHVAAVLNTTIRQTEQNSNWLTICLGPNFRGLKKFCIHKSTFQFTQIFSLLHEMFLFLLYFVRKALSWSLTLFKAEVMAQGSNIGPVAVYLQDTSGFLQSLNVSYKMVS